MLKVELGFGHQQHAAYRKIKDLEKNCEKTGL